MTEEIKAGKAKVYVCPKCGKQNNDAIIAMIHADYCKEKQP